MATQQEVLDDLIQAITNTNTSNDDFLKVLKEGRDQDVALRDGTVVPSLTKRVVNAFSNSDYLMKADNLASVVDKQEARDNLNVPTKEDVLTATAQATEAVKGTAKIATTAIAQEGINDTDIMTAKKVKDQVSMGGRIHATAYISIVGTTVTILGSKNIASVVLQSTGVFKVTTLTNMDNLNFSIAATSSLLNGEGGSTGLFAEWLNTNGTNKRTLNSFEMVSPGTQGIGNPRYFGVTVIC